MLIGNVEADAAAAHSSPSIVGNADELGQAAVEKAARAYPDRGINVDIILPKAGCKDDEWLLLHR